MILKNADKIRFTEDKSKGIHKHEMLIEGEWMEVPGATSISGLFQEDGWKFAWPVKLMEEKIIDGLIGLACFNSDVKRLEYIIKLVRESKNAWREKRDKAADTGTLGHEWIEKEIKEHGINHWAVVHKLPTDQEVLNIATQFLEWQKTAEPIWLASEVQVGSLEHRFCGILDALAMIDGKTVLIDFKTSSGIKDDYRVQLAGLQMALEEMGVNIDKRAILHLPKEGEYEFRYIEGNLEEEKKDFLAGVAFYNRKNLFMGRNKADKKEKRVIRKKQIYEVRASISNGSSGDGVSDFI